MDTNNKSKFDIIRDLGFYQRGDELNFWTCVFLQQSPRCF